MIIKPFNDDYYDVVGNCWYAFAKFISAPANYTFVIYSFDSPIAVYILQKEGRALLSHYGGLYVKDNSNPKLVRDFVSTLKLKGDYIPEMISRFLPTGKCHIKENTLLYTELKPNFIENLKSSVRYEIRKGQRKLWVQGGTVEDFMGLPQMEHKERGFFERVLKDDKYRALISIYKGKPQAGIIYSCYRDLATFTWNSSTKTGKKLFINKALIYYAMENSRESGAKYFLLGDGRDSAMNSVTLFKRSLSTNEVSNFRYYYPLNWRGEVYLALKFIF